MKVGQKFGHYEITEKIGRGEWAMEAKHVTCNAALPAGKMEMRIYLLEGAFPNV